MAGVQRGRQLVTSGRVAATGALTTTSSFTDVPGATVTFTPAVAGFAIVNVTADISVSSGGLVSALLVVDGTPESQEIIGQFPTATARGTFAQTYRVSLTAASHTLKVQGKYVAVGGIIYSPHTTLTYTFIPS